MKPLLLLTGLLLQLGLCSFACSDARVDDPQSPKMNPRLSKSGHDLSPLSKEKIQAITKTLEPIAVEVTQRAGTEPAFKGKYWDEHRKGTYVSIVGGLPLFRSEDKFDSGTGWPSFTRPIDADHVVLRVDRSEGMTRTEVRDARSGSHLGHVFEDGPPPTGKRYCMNSAALKFIPDGESLPPESLPLKTEKAYFAGGCFWGVEDVFEQIDGVLDAESGYMGGTVDRPSYKQVCSGTTGHAETVQVVFDPSRVSFEQLLKVFFDNHDPTQMNRQGPDVGTSYRSVVFAASADQKRIAEQQVQKLSETPRFQGRQIVTQIVDPGPKFWPAEDYHQDYHKKHGGSCRVKVF